MTFLSQNDYNSIYRYIVCVMLYLIYSGLLSSVVVNKKTGDNDI